MHFETDRPMNAIKISGETVMNMEVGNGWTITDVWFDHNVPAELINCIEVKFESKDIADGLSVEVMVDGTERVD